jgi:hypothetical protein
MFVFIFEGDRHTVKKGDEVIQVGTQKLDLSRSPKTLPGRVLTSFSRLVCRRVAAHLPGAQTGRRGDAGPAGA